jgi:hypothetical protein
MFTNLASSRLLKRGSGRIVRVGADALRDIYEYQMCSGFEVLLSG